MNYRNPLLVLAFSAGLFLGAGVILVFMGNDLHLLTLNGGQTNLWLELLSALLLTGIAIGSGTLLLAKAVVLLWYGETRRSTNKQ